MLSYQDHIPEPQQLCDRIGLKKLDVRQALTALTFMQLLQKKENESRRGGAESIPVARSPKEAESCRSILTSRHRAAVIPQIPASTWRPTEHAPRILANAFVRRQSAARRRIIGCSDGLHILLVEDSPDIGELVKTFLALEGATVAGPAATAAEARKLMAERRPQVALVAFHLRDGHAYRLIAHLRELGVPVIVISGSIEFPPPQ
jgi:hypothetical protein